MAQGVVGLVKGVSPPLSSAVSLLAFLPFSLLSNSQISYGEGKQECAGGPPGSGKSGGSFIESCGSVRMGSKAVHAAVPPPPVLGKGQAIEG